MPKNLLPSEVIKAKREGRALSSEMIEFFVNGYCQGTIPDYQMSALLMTIFFRGMSDSETLILTQAMLNSGDSVRFTSSGLKIDKHSTGGVGDKTSLILGPIVAAAGVAVPMISGRGLGHTGGTLDKLESIPGFNTQLSLRDFVEIVDQHFLCFIGQTQEICPADKKMYSLRDVTATVESLPLICASIMSKKLAEGIDGLVLDVKFGSGAFMKSQDQAESLAKALMAIAKGSGKKVTACLTNMNQPLGRYAGNALEVKECISVMKNESFLGPEGHDLYSDTRELSLQLAAHMLFLGEKAKSPEEGYRIADEILRTGKALQKFLEICGVQGGDPAQLPLPKFSLEVRARQSGYLETFDTEKIGVACIHLKAGRALTSDLIAPTAGIEFHRKIGSPVDKGDVIFTLWGDDPALFPAVEVSLAEAFSISLQKPINQALISKVLV